MTDKYQLPSYVNFYEVLRPITVNQSARVANMEK